MSCGLEHLSNCHGELTWGFMMLSSFALWYRTQRFKIRMWLAERKVRAAQKK